MASIGHILVGMAAARFSRHRHATTWTPFGAAVLWSGLSLLPDADVFGFRLGVHYGEPWGHRGATHSLVFALGVACVALAIAKGGAAAPPFARRLITLAVVSSHALLDTLTDGGLGCALLWPFSDERFFAPWTPLPVAPIGRAFLSAEGLRVAAVELVAARARAGVRAVACVDEIPRPPLKVRRAAILRGMPPSLTSACWTRSRRDRRPPAIWRRRSSRTARSSWRCIDRRDPIRRSRTTATRST